MKMSLHGILLAELDTGMERKWNISVEGWFYLILFNFILFYFMLFHKGCTCQSLKLKMHQRQEQVICCIRAGKYKCVLINQTLFGIKYKQKHPQNQLCHINASILVSFSTLKNVHKKVCEFDSKQNCRKVSEPFRGLLALVAQWPREAGQAFTVTGDMMARPSAVHTLGTRLAAAVSIESRGTDCSQRSVTGGEKESVASVGWNKKYIIMRHAMTCVIKRGRGTSRPEEFKQTGQEMTAKGVRAEKSAITVITTILSAATNG